MALSLTLLGKIFFSVVSENWFLVGEKSGKGQRIFVSSHVPITIATCSMKQLKSKVYIRLTDITQNLVMLYC